MSISSIDELLMGGSSAQQPMSNEEKVQTEVEEIEEIEELDPYEEEPAKEAHKEGDHTNDPDTDDDVEETLEDDHTKDEPEEDEYGNKKERMPKGMKERLDRKEKQHQREIEQRQEEINQLRQQLQQQGASREVQQAAKEFEYDPDANGDWQQQLASFVKQTVQSMGREEQETKSRYEEQKAQAEFDDRFGRGMQKFGDFREVVSSLSFDIDNPMILATRSMDNPAAFIYAAAKRHPQELERISKMRDPYAKMAEIGKLDERMRKNKPTTKAPRPLGRITEDSTVKSKPKDRDNSGDDLLAKADAKRLSVVKTRLKGNR